MHVLSLLQVMVAGLVVMACGLYWMGRLFPALGHKGWQTTGTILRGLHAPAPLVRYATRRGVPQTRQGCGGCSGCSRASCGPDQEN
ncbi:DUF6587 family protein [Komagataeibacter sp. FNDCF1]|uniref:DUF6587 family protein n=1 Tax=Komagataeibacter sp. FNDCF1 TaxID=2878681 RepID=UPI001E4C12EC|nr:DUF6587 family protein [Komagataeibacter sp. FNDCF1]MCE2565524.1 hypothetical protein [Komagataeibacter sp. FNDCF1]